MRSLRCIIVDDEPVARKVIREHMEDTPFLELAGEFGNVVKADAWLKQHEADLIFMDIEMPKKNGLQYVRTGNVKPLVIITTAYPEYALEGYELDIIDYLLKPIAFKRFSKAVQKAWEYAALHHSKTGLEMPFIFIRGKKKIEKIALDEVLFMEGAGNYIIIHTENRKFIAYLTLKGIGSQLPERFVKVHQSFLVNFMKIDVIEGNTIRVGQKTIPVSRQYKDELMELIARCLLKR